MALKHSAQVLRGFSVRPVCGLLLLSMLLCGCQQLGLKPFNFKSLARSQSPDREKDDSDEDDEDRDDEYSTKLDIPIVGDYTTFTGLHRVVLEGVGLVVGLNGTGGDPPPSHYREALVDDLLRRNIKDHKQLIASPHTALVVVRAYLPPLIRKGDHFDVEVRIPGDTGGTSLAGGRLMETILTETAIIPGEGMKKGHIVARASGPVLITTAESDEADQAGVLKRGLVLGGGLSLIDRDMALFTRTDFRTYRNITRLTDRIGMRFFDYDRHGIREPLAKAETDQRIRLKVHPLYRDNFPRYMQVVQNIAFRESPVAQRVRMKRLEMDLKKPETAETAALQLEAIGPDAISILKSGLKSSELECRFHSAVALAYLEVPDGIEVLKEAAAKEPALRVFAFAALSIIDDAEANLALRDLMNVQDDGEGSKLDSAETRYGAFRALWTLDKSDPFIAGEQFNQDFWLHVLETKGSPMVHITHRKRAEIVLFGKEQEFKTPLLLRAGYKILVTSKPGSNQITITRFNRSGEDKRKLVSARVEDVIRACAEFGASYPDLAGLLLQAQQQNNLPGRFEVDALPQAGRVFIRGGSETRVSRPSFTPNLFDRARDSENNGTEPLEQSEPPAEEDRGFATVVDARSESRELEKRSLWNPMNWFRGDSKPPGSGSGEAGGD